MAEEFVVPAEYLDYADDFLEKLAIELPKFSDINKHTINLELGKQPSYGPIYSLELLELETFQMYIKINLINGFISPSKFPARAPIF